MSLLRELVARRELLWILVSRNLKIRYKQSFLGFFWSLLGPLLLIVIYAVFASILKLNSGRPHYLQFLVIGIVTWQFLGTCLNDSLHAVLGNANLIKKTAFPRMILPLAMVLANAVNFLLSGCVLMIYLRIVGMPWTHLWLLPGVMLVQACLCTGMALLLSTANVFFRDTEHIVGIGTLAWFFMSPIMYPVRMQFDKLDALPHVSPGLAFLNPMTGIVWMYRRLLMGTAMDDVMDLAWWQPGLSVLVVAIVLVGGIAVFMSCDPRFGDEL